MLGDRCRHLQRAIGAAQKDDVVPQTIEDAHARALRNSPAVAATGFDTLRRIRPRSIGDVASDPASALASESRMAASVARRASDCGVAVKRVAGLAALALGGDLGPRPRHRHRSDLHLRLGVRASRSAARRLGAGRRRKAHPRGVAESVDAGRRPGGARKPVGAAAANGLHRL